MGEWGIEGAGEDGQSFRPREQLVQRPGSRAVELCKWRAGGEGWSGLGEAGEAAWGAAEHPGFGSRVGATTR